MSPSVTPGPSSPPLGIQGSCPSFSPSQQGPSPLGEQWVDCELFMLLMGFLLMGLPMGGGAC